MSPEVQAFASGFPLVLVHVVLSLAILAGGSGVYVALSPLQEGARLRAGDAGAASLTLAGAILGLAIPLAVSLTASASAIEILLWGCCLVVLQLAAYRLIDVALRPLGVDARSGGRDAALIVCGARLASSLILAAAVAG